MPAHDAVFKELHIISLFLSTLFYGMLVVIYGCCLRVLLTGRNVSRSRNRSHDNSASAAAGRGGRGNERNGSGTWRDAHMTGLRGRSLGMRFGNATRTSLRSATTIMGRWLPTIVSWRTFLVTTVMLGLATLDMGVGFNRSMGLFLRGTDYPFTGEVGPENAAGEAVGTNWRDIIKLFALLAQNLLVQFILMWRCYVLYGKPRNANALSAVFFASAVWVGEFVCAVWMLQVETRSISHFPGNASLQTKLTIAFWALGMALTACTSALVIRRVEMERGEERNTSGETHTTTTSSRFTDDSTEPFSHNEPHKSPTRHTDVEFLKPHTNHPRPWHYPPHRRNSSPSSSHFPSASGSALPQPDSHTVSIARPPEVPSRSEHDLLLRLTRLLLVILESAAVYTTIIVLTFLLTAAGSGGYYVVADASIYIGGIVCNLIFVRAAILNNKRRRPRREFTGIAFATVRSSHAESEIDKMSEVESPTSP